MEQGSVNNPLPYSKVLARFRQVVAYYPAIAHAFGSANVALLISQFIWYAKAGRANEGGWFTVNAADLRRETGLTRTEAENARKKAVEAGVLTEKRAGQGAATWFKLEWERFDEIMETHFQSLEALEMQAAPATTGRRGRKPKLPTEVKALPEKTQHLLQKLHDCFNEYYQKYFPIPYSWAKDKTGGKDWNGLKLLSEFLRDVVRLKKEADAREVEKKGGLYIEPPPTTDEEVCAAFGAMLKNLPEWLRKKLSPMYLYTNRNTIVQEIKKLQDERRNARSGSGNPAGKPAGAKPDLHKYL